MDNITDSTGHEFEQTPGDDEGQGSLACCSSWGHKESDTTEHNNFPCLSASSVCSLNPSLTQGPRGFFSQGYLGETSLSSLFYKYSPLHPGRMIHDQAPAYLYKDDLQPLASYLHSWAIVGIHTEVFAIPEHALLSHTSGLCTSCSHA